MEMRPTSKKIGVLAAALFTSAFVMAAPAANAEDYCITSGAQAAHGCGYPTMEACRAAASGIGGMCSSAAPAQSPQNAFAYQPRQPRAGKARRPNE
jgi:hypothetical protein